MKTAAWFKAIWQKWWKNKWRLVLMAFVLFSAGCTNKSTQIVTEPMQITHKPIFFNQDDFYRAISQREMVEPVDANWKVVLVPHHMVAVGLMAEGIRKLPPQISTVVMLAPDHREAGENKVSMSLATWQTPWDEVVANQQLVEQLRHQWQGVAGVDEGVVAQEYALADIMPLLAYYLPKAQVVPISLSNRLTVTELENMGKDLLDMMRVNQDLAIIAAVDMAHGLMAADADRNTLEVQRLINDKNYQAIRRLGNNYTDSPSSLVLLTMLARDSDSNWEWIQQSNSGQILGQLNQEVTGYLVGGIRWKIEK